MSQTDITQKIKAASTGAKLSPPVRSTRSAINRVLHTLTRWLHIYSSLLGFMTVLFFSVTGVTLNHPDWFDTGFEQTREETGTIDSALLVKADGGLNDLGIVEFLRKKHSVTAGLRDFQADDYQINVAFAGAGYTCDVRIDRETREYQLSELRLGVIPIINDLHKGRDTGSVWKVVIDVSAIILVVISLTGLLLLCWLRRRWRNGLLTLAAGSLALGVTIWLALP
ncbi:MAG: PepSY-associated TM helix domain-containing protein [Planctomycetaceae bacterium]